MNKYIRFFVDSAYRFKVLDNRGFFNNWSDERYLRAAYRAKYHKKLNLEDPKTYNEKLQWLKIYYREPIMTRIVDKYEVKKYISNLIGDEYVIPTLGIWDRFDDIDFDALPEQFVLKCTHDSGGLVICKDKSKLDKIKAKQRIEMSLQRNYYYSNREWPYKEVRPRIIAEQYMTDSGSCRDMALGKIADTNIIQQKHGLLDYKFMCFNGEVKVLFLDIGVIGDNTGHADTYYRNIYDTNWNIMPYRESREHYPIPISKPVFYDKMIQIAEILSKGFPHVRVDLYYINGQIYVGELTFFHGSGLTNFFYPEEWNYTFGTWINLPSI